QIPAPSWPIHGPVIHSAPGSAPSSIGLNDPSIIFAQPAARPVAIPNTSHDGHWPRTVAPNSLVNSGAVGNSEPGFRGLTPPIPWEHAPRPHFPLVPASWPYGLHQNFMHQGNARFQPNKPFYTQGKKAAIVEVECSRRQTAKIWRPGFKFPCYHLWLWEHHTY
ncbi:ZCCHC11 isoform 1, partial [Pongo abelii]